MQIKDLWILTFQLDEGTFFVDTLDICELWVRKTNLQWIINSIYNYFLVCTHTRRLLVECFRSRCLPHCCCVKLLIKMKVENVRKCENHWSVGEESVKWVKKKSINIFIHFFLPLCNFHCFVGCVFLIKNEKLKQKIISTFQLSLCKKP